MSRRPPPRRSGQTAVRSRVRASGSWAASLDDEVDAPVLGAPGGGLVGRDRPGLAEAARVQATAVDAALVQRLGDLVEQRVAAVIDPRRVARELDLAEDVDLAVLDLDVGRRRAAVVRAIALELGALVL